MIKMDQDFIYFNTQQDTVKLKSLAGTWMKSKQAYRFPKSVHVLDQIEKAFPKIKQVDLYQTIRQKLEEGRNKLKQLKQQAPVQVENDLLRLYQRQDVQYLTAIPNAGIFNQPRTGKTPTTIEVIKERQTKRNIIICPASLQYNWKREIEKWHEGATVHIYIGRNRAEIIKEFQSSNRTAYLIVSKDIAKRDKEQLAFPHDVLVIDEAHYLRNDDTKQSEAVYTIGYQAKHRYALTGTPTVKHAADIFGILKFLYPKKFPSKWQFYQRYFKIHSNGFGKELGDPIPHRIEELQDLIDAMSTQRLRKDVMQWLPDKERHTHLCRMEPKQQKLYQSMLEDFFAKQGDLEIDTQNVLSQLMRLRQLCLDPSLLGFNAPSTKTEAILEAIEDGTYDEPVIIMSMFTSYLNLLKPLIEKLGKRVGMITGEMTNKEKNDTTQAFQQGKLDVLLCNIISAGTGFTLDKGEVIIFTDKAWNPSDNEQAEDRITPTQQDRNHKHFIVSMVCENTIDERINQILERKESLTAFVNQCKTVDQLRMLWL